jgi:hypothetical protein
MVWYCVQKQAAFSMKIMSVLVLLEDFTQRRKRGVYEVFWIKFTAGRLAPLRMDVLLLKLEI